MGSSRTFVKGIVAAFLLSIVTSASTCEMDKPALVDLGREIVNATAYDVFVDVSGDSTLAFGISSGDTLSLTGTCDDSPQPSPCIVGYEAPTSLDIYFDTLRVLREDRLSGSQSERRLGSPASANFPGWEYVGDRDGDGRVWVRYVIGQEDFNNAEEL